MRATRRALLRCGPGPEQSIAQALLAGTPPAHGLQRVKDAFDIEEVVAEYNILQGCIHDLPSARA
jgi:two-component system, OmpR family, phosphate regulon sensor histidine kinase PhoR